MNIIEAIHDEKLFRSLFKDLETWFAWLVLLKALFGLPMTPEELALYQQCTGRRQAPEGPFRELWAVVGRRGGKSFATALVDVFLALFHDFSEYLSAGERGVIQVVSPDRATSQVILRYIKGILKSNPIFSSYLVNEFKESVDLSNNISIEVMSASYRLIRGRTVVAASFDEIAFWRAEGANPDKEILAAVRPGMATIPNAKLIVITSAYSRKGAAYEHQRDYWGRDDRDILCWRAPTRLMNPTIPQTLVDREMEKDPTSARAEWLSEFREDVSDFLSVDSIEAAMVLPGPLGPERGRVYGAFCDPSGGRSDAFTLAVGTRERGKVRVVLLKGWRAPFDPEKVVREVADVLRSYRLNRVTGDRYAAEWVTGAFKRHGIQYEASQLNKSELYLELEPLLNVGRVELPADKDLKEELMGLERRTGRSGRDVVDHGPGQHDDFANSAAGVCYLLNRAEDSFFAGVDFPLIEKQKEETWKTITDA